MSDQLQDSHQLMFGSVPSVAVARQLCAESRNCKTVNGAIMLQAVAAWMEGRELFDKPDEICETADRLVTNATTQSRDRILDTAGRLQAWVRDFGEIKEPVFIADVVTLIEFTKKTLSTDVRKPE